MNPLHKVFNKLNTPHTCRFGAGNHSRLTCPPHEPYDFFSSCYGNVVCAERRELYLKPNAKHLIFYQIDNLSYFNQTTKYTDDYIKWMKSEGILDNVNLSIESDNLPKSITLDLINKDSEFNRVFKLQWDIKTVVGSHLFVVGIFVRYITKYPRIVKLFLRTKDKIYEKYKIKAIPYLAYLAFRHGQTIQSDGVLTNYYSCGLRKDVMWKDIAAKFPSEPMIKTRSYSFPGRLDMFLSDSRKGLGGAYSKITQKKAYRIHNFFNLKD